MKAKKENVYKCSRLTLGMKAACNLKSALTKQKTVTIAVNTSNPILATLFEFICMLASDPLCPPLLRVP